MNKTNLEIIEDFSNHFCIVCKKKIFAFCGTPVVYIGGCCCGIDDDEEKILHCRTLKAHFGCYVQAKIPKEQKRLSKCSIKLKWKFKDVKKIVNDYYNKANKGKKPSFEWFD